MRIIDSGSCGKMKMSELPTGAAGEVKISWSGNGEIIENIRVELPANISVEVNSDAQVEYIRL